MPHIQPPAPGAGLWRVLIFDPTDPTDPRWLLAVIAPGDVRPAAPGAPRGEEPAVMAWLRLRHSLGPNTHLAPMPGALCWRVDEGGLAR
jgi:hypothetical protein